MHKHVASLTCLVAVDQVDIDRLAALLVEDDEPILRHIFKLKSFDIAHWNIPRLIYRAKALILSRQLAWSGGVCSKLNDGK